MAEEKKKAEKDETKAEAKAAKGGKVDEVLSMVEGMTALELAELVKAMEDKFDVSAAAPMAVAAAGTPADGAPAEEKTEFDVEITASGANKIAVIKAVREIKPDLGLKEAKDLVDTAPKVLLEAAKKEDADSAKAKLEAAGATVTLK